MNILLKYFIYFLLGIIIYYFLFNSNDVGAKKVIEGFNTGQAGSGQIFIGRNKVNGERIKCDALEGVAADSSLSFSEGNYEDNFTKDPSEAYQSAIDCADYTGVIPLTSTNILGTNPTITLQGILNSGNAGPVVSDSGLTSATTPEIAYFTALTEFSDIDTGRLSIFTFPNTVNAALPNYVVFLDSDQTSGNVDISHEIYLFLESSYLDGLNNQVIIQYTPDVTINEVNYNKLSASLNNFGELIQITKNGDSYDITGIFIDTIEGLQFKINIDVNALTTPSISSDTYDINYIVFNYIDSKFVDTVSIGDYNPAELIDDAELLLGLFSGSTTIMSGIGDDAKHLLNFGIATDRGCPNYKGCDESEYNRIHKSATIDGIAQAEWIEGEQFTMCDASDSGSPNYCGNNESVADCCEKKSCSVFLRGKSGEAPSLSCGIRSAGDTANGGSVPKINAGHCIPYAVDVGAADEEAHQIRQCDFEFCCTSIPPHNVQRFFLRIVQFSKPDPESTATLENTITGKNLRDFIYYSLINWDATTDDGTLILADYQPLKNTHGFTFDGDTTGTGYIEGDWDAFQDYINLLTLNEFNSGALNQHIPLVIESPGIDETNLFGDLWIGKSTNQSVTSTVAQGKVNNTIHIISPLVTATDNIDLESIRKFIILLDYDGVGEANRRSDISLQYFYNNYRPLDAALKASAGGGRTKTLHLHHFTHLL